MDWNKDISKIVYPIIGILFLVYYGFNFYVDYKKSKFVDIYNEQNQYIGGTIKSISLKMISTNSNIKSSKIEFEKMNLLTNKMITEGCPLLKYSFDKCMNINNKQLFINEELYNLGLVGVEEDLIKLGKAIKLYQISLITEGLEF